MLNFTKWVHLDTFSCNPFFGTDSDYFALLWRPIFIKRRLNVTSISRLKKGQWSRVLFRILKLYSESNTKVNA